VHLLSL